MYGDPLSVVQERLEKELNSIIKNGFAIMYIIARESSLRTARPRISGWLARFGRLSSFAATMAE